MLQIKQLGVTLFFLLLLSAPAGIRWLEKVRAPEIFELREQAIERYGFYLEEVSEEWGVTFVHERPQLDPRLDHILPQIASVGASVSIVDFNNDGLPDLYLTNSRSGSHNALYLNLGEGGFRDVAGELGIADLNREGTGVSMGAVWGDFDNDGFEDLFLYKWGRPELWRNERGEGFSRVENAGLPDWVNANTAVWLDYNGDGLLDLFIGGYYHEDVDLWNLTTTRIMPDSYEYATNGGRNWLLENRGDGRFADVTEQAGLTTRKWTLAAAAADLTGNGYPDLVIANDYGADEIFLNEGGRFRNVSEESGIGFIPKSGMSVAFGDIMNRGEFSIYVTNISEAGVLMQGNNLWVPFRRSDEGTIRYRNLAPGMGVEIGDWGYGGQFADLNNDGFLDLYVANGYVSDEPGTDYWYDYAKVVGGHRNVIIDAMNWPAMNGRTFSGYQNNKIWINDGAGRFREVAAAVGGMLNLDSRAVAFGDLDGDGSLDLIVANQNGPVRIYRNHAREENDWISFHLEGTGSNRSAIGAALRLYWSTPERGGQVQVKTVAGGDAFSSQSQRPLHFGLGRDARIERAEIIWPSGIRQQIDRPEPNRAHRIREPGAFAADEAARAVTTDPTDDSGKSRSRPAGADTGP